ncbi:NfeD family protein [Alkaliphilus serpentinus]|uniref:Membrane protein NfeD2 N-terminal transmembrane domain-containing protein n=1 Tax=Alkaliphilus serpentinus TaxID=1482731 RepID=A0A833M7F1_9FIRM|nr:NfeD family protein [Alkaliphilus serpentinus]KAB3530270.1 hypothetical protein F8153_07585 [Alkaliphilus serpentinus]
MEEIFDICFKTGVLFTVVSFVLGQLFGGDSELGIDTDLDVDVDIDIDSDVSIGGADKALGTVTPLKPAIIATFITVFGGVGLMSLSRGYNDFTASTLGAALGFIVAGAMYKFIIIPLHKRQSLAHSNKDLIGHEAKIILPIRGGEMGRIRYVVQHNRYTAPAKSIDYMSDLEDGDLVVIKKIEGHIFYVEKKKE